MQVKKQKICYNMKKSSVVRLGIQSAPERGGLIDDPGSVGCREEEINKHVLTRCWEKRERLLSFELQPVPASISVTCEGLQGRVTEVCVE